MATRRFFVEDAVESSARVSIEGEELVHLKKVLRLKAGDPVAVFNGRGVELEGVLESVGRDSAAVKVTASVKPVAEPRVRVTLVQGLVKKDKPELVVQKATELGVSAVVFFSGQRSVASLTREKTGPRVARLGKVAVGAAKQCGRSVVPSVLYAPGLAGAIEAAGAASDALRIMALERDHPGPISSIRELLEATPPNGPGSVVVLIGPEGGFTPEEAAMARNEGFSAVSLGPRTLRSETAAISVLSVLAYALEGSGLE